MAGSVADAGGGKSVSDQENSQMGEGQEGGDVERSWPDTRRTTRNFKTFLSRSAKLGLFASYTAAAATVIRLVIEIIFHE